MWLISSIENGPPMLKSENARLNGWTYIDIDGVDLGRYVENAQQVVAEQVELPPWLFVELVWSVRIHAARQRKAYLRSPSNSRHYYCAVIPQLS